MTNIGLFALQTTPAAAAGIEPTTTSPSDARGILDRAVVFQLELSRLGVRRKVASGAVQTDADRELLHVSKEIIESEELQAIARFDGDLRKFVASRASGPAFLNRGGFHLLALALVESTYDKITRRLATRSELVTKFANVYEERKDETRARLGSLGADVEYPSLDRVLRSFGARVRILTFDTPASLEGIRRDIFESERTKAAGEWAEALDECRGVLRAAFADLVAHLAERLTPDEATGKKRIFKDSLVRNFSEFAQTFSARNIADDRQLAALVQRAADVMAGVEAGELRTNDALRQAVAASMRDIKATADAMVSEAPTRRYSDED